MKSCNNDFLPCLSMTNCHIGINRGKNCVHMSHSSPTIPQSLPACGEKLQNWSRNSLKLKFRHLFANSSAVSFPCSPIWARIHAISQVVLHFILYLYLHWLKKGSHDVFYDSVLSHPTVQGLKVALSCVIKPMNTKERNVVSQWARA